MSRRTTFCLNLAAAACCLACVPLPAADTTVPVQAPAPVLKHGGGLSFSWVLPLPEKEYGFRSLDILLYQVSIPGSDQSLAFTTRLFCGTPKGKSVLSFGLLTNLEGKGKGVLLSRAGEGTLGDTALPPGCGKNEAWTVLSGKDGGAVGVRRLIYWGPGQYRLRLAARGDDTAGRWYELWLQAGNNLPVLCGAVRVPRGADGLYPLILPSGAQSSVEQAPPLPAAEQVPRWRFLIPGVYVNHGRTPVTSVRYSYGSEADFWPNSNIACSKKGWPIQVQLGAQTERVDPPGGF